MIPKINGFFTMSRLFVFYWATLWLLNGLDKFLNRRDLGIFTWFGKNRFEQFKGYFSDTELPESWIQPVLYLSGIWELLVFIPLAAVLWVQIYRSRLHEEWFKLGMFWSGATFVVFCIADVVFGDRAELLEHSTFLILAVVSYQLVLNDRPLDSEGIPT